MKAHFLCAALALLQLSACGWVDSTGVQGATASITLRNGQPLALIEEVPLTATLEGEGAQLQNWNWIPDDADVRDRCAGINGFDSQLSATTLQDACSQVDQCTIAMDESSSGNSTRFTLRLPQLRSPVALNFRLTSNDNGAIVERQQYLCGLSVNEAPLVENDYYTALQGVILAVDPTDPDNLLANDKDDDDVRNAPLTVARLIEAPRHAAQFSLDGRGGFVYEPAVGSITSSDGSTEDSFIYAVTDGLHTVESTAVIRIVSLNQAPEQQQPIPDIYVPVGMADEPIGSVYFDLAQYFADPDGDVLSFYLTDTGLPPSGVIELTVNGQLNSRAGVADVGNYSLQIVASDGLASTSGRFILTIEADSETNDSPDNSPPTVTDIKNRIVEDRFSYDVSGFFTDPEDDRLQFSALGLPEKVDITDKGVIRGKASDENRGTWFITVTAEDGNGGSVTDGFLLVIQ